LELMAIDQRSHHRAGWPTIREIFQGTPASDSTETKEWRSSRGVQSLGLGFGDQRERGAKPPPSVAGAHWGADSAWEHEIISCRSAPVRVRSTS
jgi:hypothetical protein